MSPTDVVDVVREAIWVLLAVASPVMLVAGTGNDACLRAQDSGDLSVFNHFHALYDFVDDRADGTDSPAYRGHMTTGGR